jgi:anti-anti-sigma factor
MPNDVGGLRMSAYVLELKPDHISVRLTGDLTSALVSDLQAALKNALDNGASDVRFDLELTAVLDSSGMGLLIATSNSLVRVGGRMQVINVSPDIHRLLQCMRLTARLNVTAPVTTEKCNG